MQARNHQHGLQPETQWAKAGTGIGTTRNQSEALLGVCSPL